MFKIFKFLLLFTWILFSYSAGYCVFKPALDAFDSDFVAHVVANAAVRAYADAEYNLRDFDYGGISTVSSEKFLGDEDREWKKYSFEGALEEKDFIFFGKSGKRVDTWGSIYFNQNQIIFAFHGSYWIADWIQNFKFRQSLVLENPSEERVHLGFLQIVNCFFENLKSILLRLDRDTSGYQGTESMRKEFLRNKELVFTGHSLGGALAIVAGDRFSKENSLSPHQLKIITFSAPRVGNDVFTQKVHKVISKEDILFL